MSTLSTAVVVGASLAGATAALTLRETGFEGDVVLVGDETELPYERPALSKSYLAGEVPRDALLVRPEEAYDELRVALRLVSRPSRSTPSSTLPRWGQGGSCPTASW